jgi:hypothetical protein
MASPQYRPGRHAGIEPEGVIKLRAFQ